MKNGKEGNSMKKIILIFVLSTFNFILTSQEISFRRDQEFKINVNYEILNDSKAFQYNEDIDDIAEGSFLTIRGISKIITVPLMMTIFNQTPIVNVSVPALGKEFKKADYEKFNKSLCTYMDSIELYMHGLGK